MTEVFTESPFDRIVNVHWHTPTGPTYAGTGSLHGGESVAASGPMPAHQFAGGYAPQYQTGTGVLVSNTIGLAPGRVAMTLHGSSYCEFFSGSPEAFNFTVLVYDLITNAVVFSSGSILVNQPLSAGHLWGPAGGSVVIPPGGSLNLQQWLQIDSIASTGLGFAFGGVGAFLDVVLS